MCAGVRAHDFNVFQCSGRAQCVAMIPKQLVL
eukprot:COSAG04_NODE_26324_length_296_cov_0.786802_2_plen_31_part_01